MAAENREQADVVIVGARVAGSPAATELARRGRKVIVLDAGTFPSDTLSTHVIFPSCVAELSALGALEPLLATGSPTHPNVLMNHGGIDVSWHYTPVEGQAVPVIGRENTTVLVKKVNDHTNEQIWNSNDKTNKSKAVLSKDGKTTTFTMDGTDKDGKPFHELVVYDKE